MGLKPACVPYPSCLDCNRLRLSLYRINWLSYVLICLAPAMFITTMLFYGLALFSLSTWQDYIRFLIMEECPQSKQAGMVMRCSYFYDSTKNFTY